MAYMRNGLDRGHGGGTPKKLNFDNLIVINLIVINLIVVT